MHNKLNTLKKPATKSNSIKFTFSGHESFQCRHLWLKKGFDFINGGNAFSDDGAVVSLGVGKNMVTSIHFWMKAFGLITHKNELTNLARKIFSDNGFDPYLEDEATLWLLHYQLVKNEYASTYPIIFNELRREKVEFTKEGFGRFIKLKADLEKFPIPADKTVAEDFTVFSKMYLRSDFQNKDKEDSFSGLLSELNIVQCFSRNKQDYFAIENSEKQEIPEEILLYCILDREDFDLSVNLSALEMNPNSVGSVFAINRPGLIKKIETMVHKYPFIVYNDQAGIKELQFKEKPPAFGILDMYYGK